MSITGDPDADGGHPIKVGVAISDVVTGLFATIGGPGRAARHGDERRGIRGAASGSTSRCSQRTLAVLVNQAQNAFVSGQRPGPARQRPPEHRPVRDVRGRRRRDRGGGRLASGSGRGSATRSACRSSRRDPRFATNGDRVEHHARAASRSSPRASRRATVGRLARAPGRRRHPAGPILDILAAFASPEADARGMTGADGAPASRRGRPGRHPVRARAHAGLDPDAAAAPRRAHATRSWPSSATTPAAIARLRADGVDLTPRQPSIAGRWDVRRRAAAYWARVAGPYGRDSSPDRAPFAAPDRCRRD